MATSENAQNRLFVKFCVSGRIRCICYLIPQFGNNLIIYLAYGSYTHSYKVIARAKVKIFTIKDYITKSQNITVTVESLRTFFTSSIFRASSKLTWIMREPFQRLRQILGLGSHSVCGPWSVVRIHIDSWGRW